MKNQLEKTTDGMPVHSCVMDRQKCWWCHKCGPEGGWTNSQHTAKHNPNFFDKKSNKKNGKSNGQVNIGEGLAPQHNLWLAGVKLPPSQPRNHFGQRPCKSRKQFGRRFNNVNSWFKKCKRCFNQLKLTNSKSELPENLNSCLPPACNAKSEFQADNHNNQLLLEFDESESTNEKLKSRTHSWWSVHTMLLKIGSKNWIPFQKSEVLF